MLEFQLFVFFVGIHTQVVPKSFDNIH